MPPLSDSFSPGRSGLLVVDMQGFFLDPASPAHMPSAAGILPRVRRLAGAFRSAGRPLAFAVYSTPPGGPMARRWRKVCRGAAALALPEGLALPGEKVLVKSRYSAFRGSPLAAWFKRRGVRDLAVAGIKAQLCVEASVRDAFEEGFSVFVPGDAVAAADDGLLGGSLRSMASGFARLTTAGALEEALSGASAAHEE
jgi:nicotinamidase-related amidase